MNVATNRADFQPLGRRSILKGMLAAPALAALGGPALAATPPVFGPAEATARVKELVEEITRLLVYMAPEGGNVDGVQWTVHNETADRLWASGSVAPTYERMNFRPEYHDGWKVARGAKSMNELVGL